jgi:hypothetical protein
MWWTWWLGASQEAALRPVVAPADVDERFARHQLAEGRLPEHLACTPLWPSYAELCFRVWEDGQRRWVTVGDAAKWSLPPDALARAVARRAPEHLRDAEMVQVEGMEARYLRLVDGDGWAAAGLLRPGGLSERLGGLPIRVAVPADSVLLAWRAGDADLDRVMAIGVRELYDATPGPVTPKVFTWDGDRWTPFGEAAPTPR